jgi:hypothetical protein
MFDSLYILTTTDYFLSIVRETSNFNKRAFTNNVNFMLIDADESQVLEIKNKRETDSIQGFLLGIKKKVDLLLSEGSIILYQKPYSPDVIIGLDEDKYEPFYNNKHGWILANTEEDLLKHFKLHTEINALKLIQNIIVKKEKGNYISVEDPYLLALKNLKTLISHLIPDDDNIPSRFQTINIKCKLRFPNSTIDRDKIINDNLKMLKSGLPKINISQDDKFHDRRVIIDGMIYIFGNSFNSELLTYVVGMDKLTYKLKKLN